MTTADYFPQDEAIQICKERIAELTKQHADKLAQRQQAEREARAINKDIEGYKSELTLHQSQKLEEIERRAKSAANAEARAAETAAKFPGLARIAAEPVQVVAPVAAEPAQVVAPANHKPRTRKAGTKK